MELTIYFLSDSVETGVGLSTGSRNFTKDRIISVIVEFTKPVFGFQASMVNVFGGRITRQVHMATLKTTDIITLFVQLVTCCIHVGEHLIKMFLLILGLGNSRELCTR